MVNNTCQVLIKRGKNAGKKCCEVHKYCRHTEQYTCPVCGACTFYKWRHESHVKSCKKASASPTPTSSPPPPPPVQPVPPVAPMQVINIQNATISNNIHIHVNGNLYEELVSKLGHQSAIDFLLDSATKQKPQDLILKLLEGQPKAKYPMAIKDDVIRYLNDQSQIVEDRVEHFVDSLKKRAHNAMLYATNEIIKQSLVAGDTGALYEIYDIGQIQSNLANLNSIENRQLVGDLRALIEQPDHAFFASGVQPLPAFF